MRPDVVDLQSFYASRQGQLARLFVARQIRRLWPDLERQRVLGLGYALPFMGPLAERAEPNARGVKLTAIPYYAWANRDPAPMTVWAGYTDID